MAVRGDVAAFGLCDLQKVHSNASQADGLRGSRTFVGSRHSLQREVINEEEKGGTGQKPDKRAHEGIVAPPVVRFKGSARRVALETTSFLSRTELLPAHMQRMEGKSRQRSVG